MYQEAGSWLKTVSDGGMLHYVYEHDGGWTVTLCRKLLKAFPLNDTKVNCPLCRSVKKKLFNTSVTGKELPKTPGIRVAVTKQSRKPMHHGR